MGGRPVGDRERGPHRLGADQISRLIGGEVQERRDPDRAPRVALLPRRDRTQVAVLAEARLVLLDRLPQERGRLQR
jgi:hypothetical protein